MLRSNSNTEQGEDRELALNLVKGSLPKRKLPATEGEPAPSQEEIDELFEDRITPETDLPPMMPLFEMFDVPCFYRGELVADYGKATVEEAVRQGIIQKLTHPEKNETWVELTDQTLPF